MIGNLRSTWKLLGILILLLGLTACFGEESGLLPTRASLAQVPTATVTPTTGIELPTIIPTATDTPSPTATETPAVSPTLRPTSTPSRTPIPIPTNTPRPTRTPVPIPTNTPKPSPTVVPGGGGGGGGGTASTATPTLVPGGSTDWQGSFFNNQSLSGAAAFVHTVAIIDFNWGSGSPGSGVVADNFSARWESTINTTAGIHQFTAFADDGVRVWLDGQLIIDEWHGFSNLTYSVERNLSAGNHSLRVEYFEITGNAFVEFSWQKSSDFPQWRGDYFNNNSLSGNPVLVRNDATINFNWGTGSPASSVIGNDNFTVRWTRTLNFSAGNYTFYARADDGVRVYLNDVLIIDEWHGAMPVTYQVDAGLNGGNHTLRVEYWEQLGDANVQFWWSQQGAGNQWHGEYYGNRDLAGAPSLIRNDADIDFRWGSGPPASGLPSDNFSVRWQRNVNFQNDRYDFYGLVDDGMRLYVDGSLVINAWETGSERLVSGFRDMSAGSHLITVEYFEGGGDASIRVYWEAEDGDDDDDDDGDGNWQASFWNDENLTGSPAYQRTDSSIDFEWGLNSPAPGISGDQFSARWTQAIEFEAGTFTFNARADDGVRVYLDEVLIIDQWHLHSGERTYTAERTLTAGTHSLRVEMFDRYFDAYIEFWIEEVE